MQTPAISNGKWEPAGPETFFLKDDGRIPNNRLPLLIYPRAIDVGAGAKAVEQVFRSHGWTGLWRNGVYAYHHYHATAHEVLGVYRGTAEIRLGGENGVTRLVEPGDVIVIPAGVGHKNLGASRDFGVVGGYPPGPSYDMNTGKLDERPRVLEAIAAVPIPDTDPVFGASGPLVTIWSAI